MVFVILTVSFKSSLVVTHRKIFMVFLTREDGVLDYCGRKNVYSVGRESSIKKGGVSKNVHEGIEKHRRKRLNQSTFWAECGVISSRMSMHEAGTRIRHTF